MNKQATLSAMATISELIDSRAFLALCGVDSSNQVPGGDTIGRFRVFMVNDKLQGKLFEQLC